MHSYGKENGGKCKFTVGKADTQYLSQVGDRVTSRKYVPLIRCDENDTLALWSPSPKHTAPVQSRGKHQTPAQGYATEHLTRTSQNCPDHQNKGQDGGA